MSADKRQQFFLIAGPCAIESEEMVMHTAERLQDICARLGIRLIFKSSYDKANRTSRSPRGVGMAEGLRILRKVKDTFSLSVLTDVHESWQCEQVAEVADILQIPAFLCRQTDLLESAARTGRVVNVKKGQFLAPWDMRGAIEKCCAAGAQEVWLTERGSSFGYGRLVVDMTAIEEMRTFGCPVIFDATHSVQQPGNGSGVTGGNRAMVPVLMRAALAVGVDGIFLEVHPDPDNAISDAANQLRLDSVEDVLQQAIVIDNARRTLAM